MQTPYSEMTVMRMIRVNLSRRTSSLSLSSIDLSICGPGRVKLCRWGVLSWYAVRDSQGTGDLSRLDWRAVAVLSSMAHLNLGWRSPRQEDWEQIPTAWKASCTISYFIFHRHAISPFKALSLPWEGMTPPDNTSHLTMAAAVYA